MFKNLMIYRLTLPPTMTVDVLETQLGDNPLQPCGSFEMESRGWLTPYTSGEYVYPVERQWMLLQGVNQKLLPAAVINQVTRERADKLAKSQEHPVGRKQLRELRECVIEELMPKALTRRSTIAGWVDAVNHRLVIDTTAPKKADEFMESLIAAGLELTPARLQTHQSPAAAMTNWLAVGEAPANFTIDQDLELRSVGEDRATVRYVDHALEGKEIRDHIAAGKTATRLGLTWKNRVSFVFTEQWQVKRIKFLELAKEGGDELDPRERFDADFVVMTGELSVLLDDLIAALGGETAGGQG